MTGVPLGVSLGMPAQYDRKSSGKLRAIRLPETAFLAVLPQVEAKTTGCRGDGMTYQFDPRDLVLTPSDSVARGVAPECSDGLLKAVEHATH